jgi:hypothetical protein
MSYMFEVYYQPPADPRKETALRECIAKFGGHLDYREESNGNPRGNVCLTYEFDDFEQAVTAAECLRQQGEYVEGPQDYGQESRK